MLLRQPLESIGTEDKHRKAYEQRERQIQATEKVVRAVEKLDRNGSYSMTASEMIAAIAANVASDNYYAITRNRGS
jgi:alpha-galactosidase/6-phospho-beta-glucosidase family protein